MRSVLIQIAGCWGVALYSFVDRYEHFRGICFFFLQDRALPIDCLIIPVPVLLSFSHAWFSPTLLVPLS